MFSHKLIEDGILNCASERNISSDKKYVNCSCLNQVVSCINMANTAQICNCVHVHQTTMETTENGWHDEAKCSL